jgi:anti-anti-sigma factor
MQLDWKAEKGCLVLVPQVRSIDFAVSDDFRQAAVARIEAGSATCVVIDLAAVEFIDSSAIGAFVALQKLVERRGGRFALADLHPHVDKIIQVVTLGTIFEIFPDCDEALASLTQA